MSKTRKENIRMRKSKGVSKTRKNVIGPLKKDELKTLGYSTSKSDLSRHRALNKSVKKYGALKTFRKLNAVATLNKNRAPSVSKVFLRDREWVNKKYIKSKTKKTARKGGASSLDNRPSCSSLQIKYRIPRESGNMNDCQKAYNNKGEIIENKFATWPEERECNQMVLYSLEPVMKNIIELLENPDKLTGELILKTKEFFIHADDEQLEEILNKANMVKKSQKKVSVSDFREKLNQPGTIEQIIEMLKNNPPQMQKLKDDIIKSVKTKLKSKQTKICNEIHENQSGGIGIVAGFVIALAVVVTISFIVKFIAENSEEEDLY